MVRSISAFPPRHSCINLKARCLILSVSLSECLILNQRPSNLLFFSIIHWIGDTLINFRVISPNCIWHPPVLLHHVFSDSFTTLPLSVSCLATLFPNSDTSATSPSSCLLLLFAVFLSHSTNWSNLELSLVHSVMLLP